MSNFHNRHDEDEMYEMRAFFTKKAMEAIKNGEAGFKNGFRRKDGAFYPEQPEFEEINKSEREQKLGDVDKKIGLGIGIGVGFVIGMVASLRIKNWWEKKGTRNKENKTYENNDKKVIQNNDIEIILSDGITSDEFSKDIDVVFQKYKLNMSSEEAQRHIIKIMLLATCLADEIRKLSNACIKECGKTPSNYLEWQKVMEKLTTQEVTDSINIMLENNISLLNEETSKTFFQVLGESMNDKFIPIKNDKIKEVLSLNTISIDSKIS